MGLFSHYHDPTKHAGETLDQIPDQVKGYYDPYIGAGQQEMGNLQNQFGQLTSDPGAFMNQLGSGFHESPGYQFALQQAMQGSGHAMAAGGMAGSPMHEQQNMQLATNLGNQYYNSYLKNVLGLYGMGIRGEEGINQMGYNASNSMANQIRDMLMSKSKLQYMGDAGRNSYNQAMTADVMKGLTAAATGGTSLYFDRKDKQNNQNSYPDFGW